MSRTKQRALVTGLIKPVQAVAYGVVLGILGFAILLVFVNTLTAAVGATGLFFYLAMYSWFKRRSWVGTLVGSVSGATPPVAGYTAVSGHLDKASALLFLILVFWQMPHFYSIAIYRLNEYKAAGLPVLPAVKDIRRAKLEMFIYAGVFTFAALSLTFLGYTGQVYALMAGAAGCFWIWQAIKGFSAADNNKWARRMFGYSLVILMILSVSISLGALLP